MSQVPEGGAPGDGHGGEAAGAPETPAPFSPGWSVRPSPQRQAVRPPSAAPGYGAPGQAPVAPWYPQPAPPQHYEPQAPVAPPGYGPPPGYAPPGYVPPGYAPPGYGVPPQQYGVPSAYGGPGPVGPPPPAGGRGFPLWMGALAVAAIALVVLGAVMVLGGSRPTATGTIPTPKPTPAPNHVVFSEPDGHFTATFPCAPEQKSDVVPMGNGGGISVLMWECTSAQGDDYAAGYAFLPPNVDTSDPAGDLKLFVEGSVQTDHQTLVSETPASYEGLPAITSVVRSGPQYLSEEDVLDDHTLFMVFTSGTSNPPPGFTSFLATFRILKA